MPEIHDELPSQFIAPRDRTFVPRTSAPGNHHRDISAPWFGLRFRLLLKVTAAIIRAKVGDKG